MDKIFTMKDGAICLGVNNEFPTKIRIVGEGVLSQHKAPNIASDTLEVYISVEQICYPKYFIETNYE